MNKKLCENDLLTACTNRDTCLLADRLSQDMKVNKRLPNGFTPIIVCCQNDFCEAIPLLCEKGVILDQGCNDTTALLEAVSNNDFTTVRVLLEYGASSGVGTKTNLRPLMLAARLGFLECIRVLLEGGASVNLTDKYHWTALHEAAQAGHAECIRLLLSHGADPLAGTKEHYGKDHPLSLKRFTPLHLASRGGHLEAVKVLLEYTPVDILAKGKETPLMFSGEIGNEETVALLLSTGANLEAVSRFGTTPLVGAVLRGDLDIIRLLLESGADPNTSYEDMGTPLVNAITPIAPPDNRNKIAIIELLLEFGADINLPSTETGDTALHQAVCARDKQLLMFLLEHGARYGARNCNRTEVDVARITGQDELVELMLKYGPRTDMAV